MKANSVMCVKCLVFGVGLLYASSVVALEQTFHYEPDNAVKHQPIGYSLFGDETSFENGATTFKVVDVVAPTNVKLPLQIGRKLVATKTFSNLRGAYEPTVDLMGADWIPDIPFISGTFDTREGWIATAKVEGGSTGRCTSGTFAPWGQMISPGAPGNPGGWPIPLLASNFWFGNTINVPGYGEEKLLSFEGAQPVPEDGEAYYGLTRSGWRVSCLPQLKRGTGEGFVATMPDGAKYYFDWLVTRDVPDLGDEPIVPRTEFFLFATKAVDRFGGVVEYSFDSALPHRLLSISASDGASIAITYNETNGKIDTISTGGETWRYVYEPDPYRTPIAHSQYDHLSQVILPDSSKWMYEFFIPGVQTRDLATGCEWNPQTMASNQTPAMLESQVFRMEHPSGAKGEFWFRSIAHGYNNVTPGDCELMLREVEGVAEVVTVASGVPKAFAASSLYRKVITGSGIESRSWDISYSPSWSFASECATGCPNTAETTVVENAGATTRYVYGNDYQNNAGQLLAKRTYQGGVLIKSESYQYLASSAGQAFPETAGIESYNATANPFLLKNRPLVSQVVSQQGVNFSSTNNSFDVFVRPLSVTRASTLGYSRTDVTQYHDNLSKWVLGQVAKVTNTDTMPNVVLSETEYNASALPERVYGPGTTSQRGKLVESRTYNLPVPATDQSGTLASVMDGRNNVTTYSNWKRGIPQLITFPATPESPSGASQSSQVAADGTITWVVDENGYKTCYGYDDMKRLASVAYPSESQTGVCDATKWAVTTTAYEFVPTTEYGIPGGHWRQTVSTGGGRKVAYLNALWQPLVEETFDNASPGGTRSIVVSRYDAGGRLAFQSYPLSSLPNGYADTALSGKYFTYDALDRVTKVQQNSELDAGGLLTTNTEYLTGFQTRVTNPNRNQTTTSYMSFDQPVYDWPVMVDQPEGVRTTITRDIFGKPLGVTRSAPGG